MTRRSRGKVADTAFSSGPDLSLIGEGTADDEFGTCNGDSARCAGRWLRLAEMLDDKLEQLARTPDVKDMKLMT